MYLPCGSSQGFTATEPMAEEVKNNIGLFGKSLDTARSKISWLDAVSYEGVRRLLMSNSNPSVSQILSVL